MPSWRAQTNVSQISKLAQWQRNAPNPAFTHSTKREATHTLWELRFSQRGIYLCERFGGAWCFHLQDYSDNGGIKCFRNVRTYLPVRTKSYPGILEFSMHIFVVVSEVSTVMCVDVVSDQPTDRTSSTQFSPVRRLGWLTSITRSIHARKSTTWERRLYFPSEGSGAPDFYHP
jgi:hypothetical protein